VVETLRRQYGQDGSFAGQYGRELVSRLGGDAGVSLKLARGQPVSILLAEALPVSIALGCGALLVGLVLGVGAGIIAARSRIGGRGRSDRAVRALATLGISTPDFVFGTGLLLLFSLTLHWLPAGGLDHPSGLVLPVLTLGLPLAAALARLTRASLAAELGLDYVRTARAKGAGEGRVVLDHALRPAAGPVLAYIAQAAAALLTGSLVVEALFALPGLGFYFVQGTLAQDWPVVSGAALLYTALLVGANLLADLALAWLDPRTR
jgi:oligopeptide transport system permease protein